MRLLVAAVSISKFLVGRIMSKTQVTGGSLMVSVIRLPMGKSRVP